MDFVDRGLRHRPGIYFADRKSGIIEQRRRERPQRLQPDRRVILIGIDYLKRPIKWLRSGVRRWGTIIRQLPQEGELQPIRPRVDVEVLSCANRIELRAGRGEA